MMAGVDVLFDGAVPVHYGFFDVGSSDQGHDIIEARRGQINGICGARLPQLLSMVTGLHTGSVQLRVEWSTDPPAAPDPVWEDVVEVSVELGRDIGIGSFAWGTAFRAPQPGWHRSRFCAVGMDAGRAVDALDHDQPSPDRYLLQLWPEGPRPEVVVRQASELSAYWGRVAQKHG